MREFWVNVFQLSDGGTVYGVAWSKREYAEINSDHFRQARYRLHVKLREKAA